MRPKGVCLIGPGRVGSAALTALGDDPARWRLESVVVRELRPEHLTSVHRVTTDGASAVTDDAVDVVIDTSSDANTGYRLLRIALRAGKVAVTANKDLALRYGTHLQADARASGGQFGYDAAVCAALPVTRVLREHCATDRVVEVDGLFSGTCNYVLTEMGTRGLSLAEAVATAQRLGYAEPDSTDDLSGLDAARKTALIAQLVTGHAVPLSTVSRIGIAAISPDDLDRAASQGQVIRLVSRIRLTEDGFTAFVAPMALAATHPFVQATGVDNVLRIRAEHLGTITVTGAGAGVTPTAAGLLADAHTCLIHCSATTKAQRGAPRSGSRWFTRTRVR